MSDVMLHAVLNMPVELWSDSDLDKMQRHARYVQASKRIQADEETIQTLATLLQEALDRSGQAVSSYSEYIQWHEKARQALQSIATST